MRDVPDFFPGYVMDTSALIDLKPYPQDIFKTLWENLEALIREGNLVAPTEVLAELERQRDELLKWVKKNKFFVDLEPSKLSWLPRLNKISQTWWIRTKAHQRRIRL